MKLETACGTQFEIDEADWQLVGRYSFNMWGDYINCSSNGINIRLAHLLMNPPKGLVVDHIDGDRLNNKRENLRVTTYSVNNQNRPAWGFYPKGISFDETKQLYRARIQVDGKRIGLGRYKSLSDAVAAYNKAAKEYYGENCMESTCE